MTHEIGDLTGRVFCVAVQGCGHVGLRSQGSRPELCCATPGGLFADILMTVALHGPDMSDARVKP